MGGLVVVVPSRGRPANAARLRQAWHDTCATAELWVCVDDDDPTIGGYPADTAGGYSRNTAPRLGLAGTLNAYAAIAAVDHRYVGFMGDDHLPRTVGWSKHIVEALDELGTGIVYGDDLFQGAALPTAVFVTADIVNTLGYLCPPGLRHMYLDNVWKAWGEGIGRLAYLPDVVIEHVHPQAGGKAAVDDGYNEVWQLMGADADTFRRYMADGYPDDIARLRALL